MGRDFTKFVCADGPPLHQVLPRRAARCPRLQALKTSCCSTACLHERSWRCSSVGIVNRLQEKGRTIVASFLAGERQKSVPPIVQTDCAFPPSFNLFSRHRLVVVVVGWGIFLCGQSDRGVTQSPFGAEVKSGWTDMFVLHLPS